MQLSTQIEPKNIE